MSVYDTTGGWRTIADTDLPSSGVTAGTYGDATHVSQVTIDAQGLVTSAANVVITGGGGGITDLTSTGATITVTSPTGPTTNVDLPNSGVAAATYGDSTHVGQFAVNAKGIITSASSVAVSGLAGTGLVVLFDSTLGGAAASIDTGANGIAAGHRDLIVYLITKTADVAVSGVVDVTLNGDTAANYDTHSVRASGATVTGGATLASSKWPFNTNGATSTLNYPGVTVLTIPSYDQTTFFKTASITGVHIDSASNNQQSVTFTNGWRSTAAINQLTVTGATANLAAGSRLVVYGTQ